MEAVTSLLFVLLCLSVMLASSNGFVTTSGSRSQRFMSEPSDTSSDYGDFDDFLTVESEDVEETAEEKLISNVLDMMPNSLGEVSSETRSTINEALYRMEASNPTANPTTSPLLNGVWELRYAGGYSSDWAVASPTRQLALFVYSGGYSPGIFALGLAQKLPASLVDIGDLEITISRDQPRVEAKVPVKFGFGGMESDVVVKAKLEVESDIRIRETYTGATAMSQEVDIPAFLQYARDLYVTYLDGDLLVVRDASGVPEILVRKDKVFSQNWGNEPESLSDMVPPGEE